MPDGHNGYVDTKLELGYIGLALLLTFIVTTLHSLGRMADRDPRRAWIGLSLALYVIVYNFLESLWMRGYEFLWLMFVIVAAEIRSILATSSAEKGAAQIEQPEIGRP